MANVFKEPGKLFIMRIHRYPKRDNRETNNKQFEIYAIESISQEREEGQLLTIFNEAYAIIWIKKGSGEMFIDLKKYELEEHAIYFARPAQTIICSVNEPATGFIISFSKSFLDLCERDSSEVARLILFNHFFSLPVIKINNDVSSFFENIGNEMIKEFQHFFDLKAEILKSSLRLFILYLSRYLETDHQDNFQSRKTDLVKTFFSLLEKNYICKKMVREYAEILSVTPGYLNEAIKEFSGFPASHHIQQRLLLEAKRRAIYEGCSMKEIAYYLGFWDPAHFSKFFKNISGVNFTDFRKESAFHPAGIKDSITNGAPVCSRKMVA